MVEEVEITFEHCVCTCKLRFFRISVNGSCNWETVEKEREPFFINNSHGVNPDVPASGYFSRKDAIQRATDELAQLRKDLNL